MRSSLVQGRLGQGPTTSVSPRVGHEPIEAWVTPLAHSEGSTRRYAIQPGSASTGRLKPSERLILLAQRNAKTPLLSLWQRDGERRSCIGR
jgi:hypothetical protein